MTKVDDMPSDSQVETFGNVDDFKLLTKVEWKSRGLKKSTKAMELPGGCLVQVSTSIQRPGQPASVAEALHFVPGVVVHETRDGEDLTGRYLDVPNES